MTAPPFVVHDRDCAPCDAAQTAVYALMEHWDPNEAWVDVEALDGPGSLYDEAVRIVAAVLHQFPIPTRTEASHG